MKKGLLAFALFIVVQFMTYSQCQPREVEIKVTFVSDMNGDENDWQLKLNGTIILKDGPFTQGEIGTYIQTVCVAEDSELDFVFHDAGGNSFFGSIKVESCGNLLYYHSGYMASYLYAKIHAQACNLAQENEVEVFSSLKDVITFDDLRWSITGVGGSPVYGSGALHNNYNYEFKRTVVPEGIPLEYRLINLNGGGLSNDGIYEIGYNCVNVATGGDDFDILKVIAFDAPFANPGNIVFEKKIGAEDVDNGRMVQELCEGGYIIAGVTGPENINPLHQAYLIKTNAYGEVIWDRQYGGNGNDLTNSVKQMSDGGYLMSGSTVIEGETLTKAAIIKAGSDGDIIFFTSFGGDKTDVMNDAIETRDNGIVSIGSTSSEGAGKYDVYLAKANAEGSVQFTQTYGDEFDNFATSITELADGSLLMVGYGRSSDATPWNDNAVDALILRTSNTGVQNYYRTLDGPSGLGDQLYALKALPSYQAIAGGYTKVDGKGTEAYLIKFNAINGDTIWTLSYGEDDDDIISAIDIDQDGNYIVFGTTGNWYTKTQKVFISAVSESGELLWTKFISNPGVNVSANSGLVSSKGGYVITGGTYFNTFPDNRPDLYFFKTDENVAFVSQPEISGVNIFCEGETIVLTASQMDVGSGISYSWSNGMTGQSIEVGVAEDYTVTVSDRNGNAKTSSPFSLSQVDLPQMLITSENDSFICAGTSIDLTAEIQNPLEGTEYSYLWTNGETTEIINTEDEAIYGVAVTESVHECIGFSPEYKLDVQKPFNREKICMVSVYEETSKNMIVYSKTPDVGTKAFIIWKETEVSYLYEPIGAVDYNKLNYFIDKSSNPSTQADRYKISVLDVCDNQSLKSTPHKTMHLTVNAAGGGADDINLIWDHYEGFYFGSYVIYRGSESSKMDSIHSIQSTLTSWTDDNPPAGDVFYQVAVRKNVPCVLVENKKAGSGPFVHSLSNLEDNRMAVGMNDNNESGTKVLVYPNPVKDYTNIVYSLNKESRINISLYNSLGKKLADVINETQAAGEYHYRITEEISNVPEGVYFLSIRIGDKVRRQTLLKVK